MRETGSPRWKLVPFAIGDILGHLAQAVHVVDENNQAGFPISRYSAGTLQLLEGFAHVRGPQNLGHGAEMRPARGSEAALENRGAAGLIARDPLGDLFGLLVGP